MRNLILATLLFIMPFGVMAGSETVDFGDLTPKEIAELKLQIEQRKAQATTEITADEVSEYTVVGQQVAQALIAVAGELGKEVDEVLNTMTGKLILALVIWKVAGSDLIGLGVGLLWFLVMIPLWIKYFRKFCIVEREEFHENGKIKTRYNRDEVSGDRVAVFLITAAVIIICGFIMIFV